MDRPRVYYVDHPHDHDDDDDDGDDEKEDNKDIWWQKFRTQLCSLYHVDHPHNVVDDAMNDLIVMIAWVPKMRMSIYLVRNLGHSRPLPSRPSYISPWEKLLCTKKG